MIRLLWPPPATTRLRPRATTCTSQHGRRRLYRVGRQSAVAESPLRMPGPCYLSPDALVRLGIAYNTEAGIEFDLFDVAEIAVADA